MVAVYFDDLIIAGDNLRLIVQVKDEFNQRYKVQDLREMEFVVLGLEVAQSTS